MGSVLGSIVAFAVVFGVVVLVHEFGHFIVAKMFGIRVSAFSVGFGKAILSRTLGETEYKICIVPLGGYVRFADGEPPDARDFRSKPRWQRLAVMLAGPAMNFLLAISIVATLFIVGDERSFLVTSPSVIGAIEAGSPAETAGLMPEDRVVSINGERVNYFSEVQNLVLISGAKPLAFIIERGGVRLEYFIVPDIIDEKYELGHIGVFPIMKTRVGVVIEGSPAKIAGIAEGDEIISLDGIPVLNPISLIYHVQAYDGKAIMVCVLRDNVLLEYTIVPVDIDGRPAIGVVFDDTDTAKPMSPLKAVLASIRFEKEFVAINLKIIGRIASGDKAATKSVSGPIGIAQMSGDVAKGGIANFSLFIAIISISIGLMNLLPIPLMDGGQIAILLVETVARRDIPDNIRVAINMAGFLLIVILFVLVIFMDIMRFF